MAKDNVKLNTLAQAAQKAAEYSYNTSKEQLDWAKQVYGDNKQVGDQVIDFALGQMDKQAAWADQDRARYEDIYQPLEEQAAARAQDYVTPERQEAEAGKAEADVAQEFDRARRAAADRLEAFGVDPSQVRSGALDLGTRVAQGAAEASAGNQARFRTEQYGDQLMSNAINTGKGYPAQSLAAAGQAGASGNQATNTGLATTASGANTMGTGTQWQGLGNQAIGTSGQIVSNRLQSDLAKQAANQSSSSGFGSFLGTAASFLPMFGFAEGGAIPDDIEAELPDGGPAKLNANEFVVPADVTKWLGEKGLQQIILKARKEMQGGNGERPAQPQSGPPPGTPPIPPRGVGAIPEMEGPMP
jgi:hypothetical protein